MLPKQDFFLNSNNPCNNFMFLGILGRFLHLGFKKGRFPSYKQKNNGTVVKNKNIVGCVSEDSSDSKRFNIV